MTLTVGIPTFNARPDHLAEALESIAGQARVDEVEVLVVDNGSNPENSEFLRECAQRFPQFRFVRHESNLGYDRNLLRLVDDVHTDFLWFFGDDDILFPGAIESMLATLAAHPTAHAVLSTALFFHETSELRELAPLTGGGAEARTGVGFIEYTAYTAAALSTLCVSVAAFRATDVEFAVGTNWIHFAALLQIFSAVPAPMGVAIERSLVAVRRSNAARWFANFGNQYRSGLTLVGMVHAGKEFGLDESLYEFFRQKRYAANLVDILTLAWPLSSADRRALYRESRVHFGRHRRFRLLDGPVLRSPNWTKMIVARSISAAGQVKRAIRKR